jgi:hypothetical protein
MKCKLCENEIKDNSRFCVILPKIWTKGLVKKSLNLTKQYDKTNTPQIFA